MLSAAAVALIWCSVVAVADHDVEVALFYDGQWNAAPAYSRDGITLSRGAAGEGQDAPPSSAALTLAGSDHNPRNVTGPLYGFVGRNTPMRVSADGSVRSTTEAASWKPGRAVKGDAWTAVEGGGILRRLQQGTTPLKSSLERAILTSNPVAFWPLSDGKEATALLSGLEGGTALTLYGARPGEVEGPAAAGASFVDVAGTPVSARGQMPSGLPAAGWGVEFLFYVDAQDPDGQTEQVVLQWAVSGQPWIVWVGVVVSTGNPYIVLGGDIGADQLALANQTTASYGWNHARFVVEQVGGNVEGLLYVNGVNLGGLDDDAVTGTLAAPTGEVVVGQLVEQFFPEFTFEQASIGMLAFYALADAADHSDAAFGYIGELAGVRFLRVLGEEGVPAVVIGDENDTQPMGAQPADTLVNIARECVRTDDGLMFEPRDDRALAMRTGRDRYNQDAAVTLDFAGEQIAPGLVPVLDDQNTRNDVTAQRRNGGSAQARKLTGPMNINDPVDDPEGIGRVDTRVDVNTATDDVLFSHASWHLAKGTVDEPRYPGLTVDLDAPGVTPALLAAVNALEIGDKVEVENLPTEWQYGNAELLLLGVRENHPAGAGDYRRTVTLNTGPASVFEIGIVGANDGSTDLRGQAVDTDNSTLTSGINAYVTSLSVTSTGGVVWTTNSADWNPALNGGGLYLLVGGEEMRVTNITGASSPQTFTVARSTNGVVKAHLAGTAVHARNPVRVGL